MSKVCNCPVGTYPATFTVDTCPTDIGQIQKLIFWRRGNEIADVATMIVAATWTTLKAATNSTKAVVSPFIDNPVFEPGEIIEVGSGNEVRDGQPRAAGLGPTKFTFEIPSPSSAVLREMKDLECETLDVVFVNQHGYFVHTLDAASDVQGFQINNLVTKDRSIGGFNAFDKLMCQFYLKPNWADNLTITDPTANFSALDL